MTSNPTLLNTVRSTADAMGFPAAILFFFANLFACIRVAFVAKKGVEDVVRIERRRSKYVYTPGRLILQTHSSRTGIDRS